MGVSGGLLSTGRRRSGSKNQKSEKGGAHPRASHVGELKSLLIFFGVKGFWERFFSLGFLWDFFPPEN